MYIFLAKIVNTCYNKAMFEGISGHKRQLELLEKSVANGKLSHAYLFAGPEGVGKRMIAMKMAEALLTPQPSSLTPDLIEIDGKDGIKIEQIRELIYKLSLKPYSAKYKVAVIDAAEQMTIEAANALLKSLEEPKPYTIIILITSNPNRLPKTIISRTQKINFGLVEGREVKIADENYFQIFQGNSLADRLLAVTEIAELETSEIKQLLQGWLYKLSLELQNQPTMKLKQKIDQVALSAKYLEQNANSKLLLTNLMLNT